MKRQRARPVFLLAFLLFSITAACVSPGRLKTAEKPPAAGKSDISEKPPLYLGLIAVGDNLIHNTVYRAAKTENGYDFTPMYAPVKDLITKADIAFVNQEAPLATDIYAASGYPNFNTPKEAGRDLVLTGFDVVNQANNHAMDKGANAVLSTVGFWKKQSGAVMTGMFESEKDRQTPRIIEKNGIKVGFIAYTYGTNGISVPKDKAYLVPLIDRERIKQDIEAYEGKCDVLVASMHWGAEYNLGVTDEQRDLARFLTGQGVDLIIGHHPHVIEPAEWIETENGGKSFCIYSLGNFISSQEKRIAMLGGMLKVTIRKNSDNKISILNPGILPLVTHYEKGGVNFKVYPLSEYTDDLAKKHFVNTKDKPISVGYLSGTAKKVLGSFLIQ